ncbi:MULTISPECIES: hypothetical protein [unclassified Brevundimonas]|uniref:hypothetical protein n=1 Tax=unclassified Brevundimonas TaxID=2622653 RepID=UPI000CFD29F7|nr:MULTISPECIES: hypothetical protein [unclassified Brevundimonas]PRA36653.1 hypothetical protein CQ024_00650 [Brevundimonas sp. MYb27]PQZ79486.1 hypothetical protein CQ026_11960 [Brevundimonas sp. MYb31]PRB12992.1 hypothetical protein CQ039_13665 [Brevundimonas sp. MYb52]PRB33650.1 hypothetical protein CQ035_12855 [Brevundimonas sp. MYb46]PRB48901.1 hypothetical protein CQ028_08945 [Brevundimonas sp. MYb33]
MTASSDHQVAARPPLPTRDGREIGWRAAKATLGSLPGVGALATEVLELLVSNPVEERRAAWLNRLAADLDEVTRRVEGVSPETLATDPRFVSLMIEATARAEKTHQQSKLHALRNAVLNAAAGLFLDDALTGTFLGYIERFSPTHLRVLAFLNDPTVDPAYVRQVSNTVMGSIHTGYVRAHPEVEKPEGVFERIVKDLGREGLIQSESLMTSMSGSGLQESQTTPIGRAFLRFIAEPDADQSPND